MFEFLKEKKTAFGIRASLENFGKYEQFEIYPLYAVGNIKN